jgi:hypothetical protein
MRIKLKKGKQRELINIAKLNYTWQNLGKKLGYSSTYIRNEIRNENCLISEKTFNRLCNLTKKNFN